MHIRYNETSQQYEYSHSGTNTGPWTVLPLTNNTVLPANVAYKNINNSFSTDQNITGALGVSGNIFGSNILLNYALYESNRSVPVGYWTSFTPVLAGVGGIILNSNYTSIYMLIGKTLFISFYWVVTTGPNPQTSFQVPIPSGFTSAALQGFPFQYGIETGMAQANGSNTLYFFRDTSGGINWPVNYNMSMVGTVPIMIA